MKIAPSADLITPVSVGNTIPNGPLTSMDGKKTTLYDVVQNKPAVIIFYRGMW